MADHCPAGLRIEIGDAQSWSHLQSHELATRDQLRTWARKEKADGSSSRLKDQQRKGAPENLLGLVNVRRT